MKSTKYLTGKLKGYFEPEQSRLALKRISACRELMAEIATRRRNNELEPDDLHRYLEAEKAVDWWEGLLNET